jgi:hypothetical protein
VLTSLRRAYHRRFGYHERFHLAVLTTIIVVAWVVVPYVVDLLEALSGYAPTDYEPKDLARRDWLLQRSPSGLPVISLGLLVDALLIVLVALVWLTVIPPSSGRGGPGRQDRR